MLSNEARKFLLDMRLFLTAKSVKESDIESFIEDAELHLIEGESNGKSVEEIFGSSPKEYANELVKVMERDRQETWKQIGFTVMNIVSFWIIASVLIVNNGLLQMSLIQCVGYSLSLILVVIGPNFLLRKMTFVTSFTKTWFAMWSLVMGIGPAPAIRKGLEKVDWSLEDADLLEINEAFAAQYLAVEKELGLDREKVNVNGSGVGLGHPIGCTGARITVSLIHELKRRGLEKGIASLCVGGGIGVALFIEAL